MTTLHPTMPHHQDDWLTVYQGDCRDVLPTLPDASVHCVVTSPPYWGLRDYGTATWIGGDEDCDHTPAATGSTQNKGNNGKAAQPWPDRCRKCGATRQDAQLGLEPTPEQYVANLVAVFREVRRVLRDDGTVWLNLGDTMVGRPGQKGYTPDSPSNVAGSLQSKSGHATAAIQRHLTYPDLKPKDLVGIPWRVAFALQADGWYLRSDIIWSKPNPMPESVTDRPTKAHEYLFLLSKRERYYYDQEAVREPNLGPVRAREKGNGESVVDTKLRGYGSHAGTYETGRNLRSVWTIATRPYPGAHFAVFPPELPERCIKAGTSERGVCPECGAPWERLVELGAVQSTGGGPGRAKPESGVLQHLGDYNSGKFVEREHITTGWKPTCSCATQIGRSIAPAVVLDPFAGSGTVGLVANRLSRRAILIDLNPAYITQQMKRNAQLPAGLTA